LSDLFLISGSFILYSILHSLMAGHAVKNLLYRLFPGYFNLYRMFYNITQILLFLLLWFFIPKPAQILWTLDGMYQLAARSLQVLSLLGLLLTLRDFSGSEFLGWKQLRDWLGGNRSGQNYEKELCTTGMYAVVRHPIYLFSILLVAFEPVMTLFKFSVLIWLILYFYTGSYFEERRLVREFGAGYQSYQQRISRLFPIKWITVVIMRSGNYPAGPEKTAEKLISADDTAS